MRRLLAVCAGAAVVAVPVADAASATGIVSGAVSSISGKSFTIKTTTTSSGSSKVKITSKTAITKQAPGSRTNLKSGDCIRATGTSSGSAVKATELVITGTGACAPTGGGGGLRAPSGASGPPAGFKPGGTGGFAFGTVTSVKGSTVTVSSRFGSRSIVLASNAKIMKTVSTTAKSISVKECALVRGSSKDQDVALTATTVSLSAPVNGSCQAGPGR